MNRTTHCGVSLLVLAMTLFGAAIGFAAEPLGSVNESARALPVAYDVDVLVVGGSTGAVAAATAAAATIGSNLAAESSVLRKKTPESSPSAAC